MSLLRDVSILTIIITVTWAAFSRQVLTGNYDRDTRVDNHLNTAIEARFIRFIPSDWLADDICMRVAIFKCRG